MFVVGMCVFLSIGFVFGASVVLVLFVSAFLEKGNFNFFDWEDDDCEDDDE